jgi:uncharacterized protein YdeI (YjbR/CyaY-like superfamily)
LQENGDWSAGVLSRFKHGATAEMKIRFFNSSSEFREWLETNHEHARELILGFYKKGSGRKGISYAESVDEALCFGWIDGVRKNLDAISSVQRRMKRGQGGFRC